MTTSLDSDRIDGTVAVPPILYKYASWQKEYQKRLITHREIFFASARQFNDPFDSAIQLRWDLETSEEKLSFLKRYIPTEFPDADPNYVDQLARERLNSGWFERMMAPERLKEELEDMYNTTGHFSVSKVWDSILMWSHYADSHSGFCVGYDAPALDEQLAQLDESSGSLLFDHRAVQYSPYPLLIPSELDDEDFVLKRTHLKALDWSHEEEWRFIVLEATNLRVQLPPGIIKEVIVGCRMCDAHKDEIQSLARKTLGPSVTFWQTKPKVEEFGLERVRLA
jgi:hypothetical protein